MEDRSLLGLTLVIIRDSGFWVKGMLVERLLRRVGEGMILVEDGVHDLGR